MRNFQQEKLPIHSDLRLLATTGLGSEGIVEEFDSLEIRQLKRSNDWFVRLYDLFYEAKEMSMIVKISY
jgi:hypothetical protein